MYEALAKLLKLEVSGVLSEALQAVTMVLVMSIATGWLFPMIFFGLLVCGLRWPEKTLGYSYHSPFYPFRRWTWQSLPSNWKYHLGMCLLWGACSSFATIRLYFRSGMRGLPIMLVFGFMGLSFAVTAVRIALRVTRLGNRGSLAT